MIASACVIWRNGSSGAWNDGSSCGSCRRLREGVVDDGADEVLDIVEGVVGGDERELRLEVLVVCKVADRPARLRAVARLNGERQHERRDGSRGAAAGSASSTRVVEVLMVEHDTPSH